MGIASASIKLAAGGRSVTAHKFVLAMWHSLPIVCGQPPSTQQYYRYDSIVLDCHVFLSHIRAYRRQSSELSRSHSHRPDTGVSGWALAISLQKLLAIAHWAAVIAVEAHERELLCKSSVSGSGQDTRCVQAYQ